MTQPSDTPTLRPFTEICLGGIILAFAIGWWNAGMIKEGGALELATVVALLMVTAVIVLRLPSLAFGPEWHLPVLTALLAARELDFDKRFIETGILKLRLYTGDEPVWQKIVGAMVIVLILTCVYRLVAHNGRSFLQSLRAREGWAILTAIALMEVVVAKSVDGLGRKLAPLGVEFSSEFNVFLVVVEELLEFGFAVALLLAVFLWIRRHA